MLTHGHEYRVKLTPLIMVDYAKQNCCDIVCFGHTHEQYMVDVERAGKDNMHLINPGSVADGNFATVDIPRPAGPSIDIIIIKISPFYLILFRF